jgi:hypothetical protein
MKIMDITASQQTDLLGDQSPEVAVEYLPSRMEQLNSRKEELE